MRRAKPVVRGNWQKKKKKTKSIIIYVRVGIVRFERARVYTLYTRIREIKVIIITTICKKKGKK